MADIATSCIAKKILCIRSNSIRQLLTLKTPIIMPKKKLASPFVYGTQTAKKKGGAQ
jgi:hypothetical protein